MVRKATSVSVAGKKAVIKRSWKTTMLGERFGFPACVSPTIATLQGQGVVVIFAIKLSGGVTMEESSKGRPPFIAINMSKVRNCEESFQQMHHVGPRVCITTASHPGFVGF